MNFYQDTVTIPKLLLVCIVALVYYRAGQFTELIHNAHVLQQSYLRTVFNNSSVPSFTISETKNALHNYTVLDYTKFFHGRDMVWWWEIAKSQCKYNNCIFTQDRTQMVHASVVLFHCRDMMTTKNMAFFKKNRTVDRYPNQVYVFVCLESPAHTPTHAIVNTYGNNFFNWTITYHSNSTIQMTAFKFDNITKDFVRKNIYKRLIGYLRNKSEPVAWFVSNCHTSSRREHYVQYLQKFIEIDIFGSCGTKKCHRQPPELCLELLSRKYYFYLAFENSLCEQYVTEKIFNALRYYVIPIVLIRDIYADYPGLPQSSFIAADDFQSPHQLANHLKYLMKNRTAYLEYFQWQKQWTITNKHYEDICKLCEMVNNGAHRHSQGSTTVDLQRLWGYQQCTNPRTTVLEHFVS